ncbi:dienelactone hydrolase family protein [Thiohalorhabdus sp. Cl-TMA]|uniref:Dienelactone hydrolase family protein n=1 Tax=Thiohalorhabdus methylotrophus TaxID=3242694 RepID=A0ABV4TTA8_9GAMM
MAGEIVQIPLNGTSLDGELVIPDRAEGLVIFVHGSGSSRLSPRNNYVARVLQEAGMATFLFDLLTASEDQVYANRFDIPLLSQRLITVVHWVRGKNGVRDLPLGLFGASTGAAAALRATAELGETVDTVVSRGGRPDLAGEPLARVRAPVLLIVGGLDQVVIDLNQEAAKELAGESHLEIVPGATHLFEEEGKLERVAELASRWLKTHLAASF